MDEAIQLTSALLKLSAVEEVGDGCEFGGSVTHQSLL